MKRETRVNLLFLAAFVLVSLPGAVILFRKKLNPASRPIFMDDPVERRLPYMAAGPTPPGYLRVTPPLAARWLAEISRERGGIDRVAAASGPHGNPQPVISEGRALQLVDVRRERDALKATLVWWDASIGADAGRFRVSLDWPGPSQEGRVTEAANVPVPPPVKLELMNSGAVTPPTRVTWLRVEWPAVTPPDPGKAELRVTYADGARTLHDTLSLPAPASRRSSP